MISYTSGTTGEPKGALISNSNLSSLILAVDNILTLNQTDRHISYLPLAHIFERAAYLECMAKKVPIFIFSGDMLKIKEDLQIA